MYTLVYTNVSYTGNDNYDFTFFSLTGFRYQNSPGTITDKMPREENRQDD